MTTFNRARGSFIRWLLAGRVFAPGLFLAAVAATLCAADPAPTGNSPAGGGSTLPASAPGLIRLNHVTLDRAKRTIVIDAEVCFSPDSSGKTLPLELFLCKEGTKDYEAVLNTKAQPSDVHAALLALGLTPGKPARVSHAETQPATFLPPDGPRLAVTLRWKGADGNMREAPAGQWLRNPAKKDAAPVKDWVFVGSEVLPGGRYWADQDGDIISLANFASAVIDVPIESKADWSRLEFAANEKTVPLKQTPVEVVIHPLEGGETAPAARVILEIDRHGRFWIEGKQYDIDELAPWATQYLQKHVEGMVVLRADPRAEIQDLARAKDQLRFGGVSDIDEEKLGGPDEPLPRAEGQADWALKRWKDKFARWDKQLTDPFEDAQEYLGGLQQEIKDLDARKAMLAQYAGRLKTAMDQSRAATQAAPKE
jgi:biopolymer transport protein ExbD